MKKYLAILAAMVLMVPSLAKAETDGPPGPPNGVPPPFHAQGGAGGAGGEGGEGGVGIAKVKVKVKTTLINKNLNLNLNKNLNVNKNLNINKLTNKQYQEQEQGQYQGQVGINIQKDKNKQTVTVEGDTTIVPRQAPPAFAPALSASNGTCMGSSSFGLSGPVGGVSIGSNWKDNDCNLRYFAAMATALKLDGVALTILSNNEMFETALRLNKVKFVSARENKKNILALASTSNHRDLFNSDEISD